MRRTTALVIALLLLALTAVGAGCAADSGSDHPAVVAIRELLELRRDDVSDPEAYAPYFLESSLATALAESSAEETSAARIPKWEDPYLTAETTSTADVAVVWKASDDFPDWPFATVFMLSRLDDRWVVIDAKETTSSPEPLGTGSR